MKQYLELMKDVYENGAGKDDRTGTGTRSVFGRQIRFDLNEGFPLVTTKKMFVKGMIEELLWFISGSVDVGYLKNRGVNFWNSWEREDGTIGDGYGTQFCNIKFLREVTPRIFKKPDRISYPKFKGLDIDLSSDTFTTIFRVGQKITDFHGRDWVILKQKVNSDNGRAYWEVGSVDNNYTCDVTYTALTTKNIRNPFLPTVEGVGYYGDIKSSLPNYDILVRVWRDMLKRCYNKKSKTYKSYGGKGYFVCERWLNFSNFYRDAQTLPQWTLKLEYPERYSLDKDILYASNCYHKETCMWASDVEQSTNTTQTQPIRFTGPSGETIYSPSLSFAAKSYGLNISAIHRCLEGTLKSHHGYSNFERLASEGGSVIRYRSINQMARLIADLKHNPDSRRLIISLWNAHDIDYMELPCCHGSMIQFYVEEGKLSCCMYQRSADVLLGVPVNIASYALLTMMVAQVCDLELGEFIHTFGDVHIYNNHVDQVKLQLSRTPHKLPTMKINPEVKNIDDFKYEDFKLVNYKSWPAIKAPISV